MEQTSTLQQESTRGDSSRTSRMSSWYARVRAKPAELSRRWRSTQAPAAQAAEPGFARAARLTVWAPSAVLGAGIGAALAAVSVVWAATLFWRDDADTGKVIAISTFASAYVLFLVLFAMNPTLGQMTKRLWAVASVVLLFLGGVALLSAITVTAGYFGISLMQGLR